MKITTLSLVSLLICGCNGYTYNEFTVESISTTSIINICEYKVYYKDNYFNKPLYVRDSCNKYKIGQIINLK